MSSPLFSSKLCHPPPTQTHFFTLVSWISCRMDGWGAEEVRERGKKPADSDFWFDQLAFSYIRSCALLAPWSVAQPLPSCLPVTGLRFPSWVHSEMKPQTRAEAVNLNTAHPISDYPLPATQTRGWDWRSSLLSSNATPANRFRPAAWWVSSLPFLEKKPHQVSH